MDQNDVLKLENQLCFSIYAASRAITKVYRPFLERLGITYPQYLVMLVLWEKDKITLKDLCKKLYLDSGTLTPLLKRLETMDMVKRVRSSEDERVLCVSITDKGRNMKQEAIKIPECILGSLNTDVRALANLKNEVDQLLIDINE
ncbi:MAG: ohrR [Clostridia bacterium]|jgi:DNA-binding MarR family transcriptional regulator|nr:ohrR [Clostridia bacterium]